MGFCSFPLGQASGNMCDYWRKGKWFRRRLPIRSQVSINCAVAWFTEGSLGASRESELLALIDSGLRLLKILRRIPRQTYKVSAVVPFFSDASATVRVEWGLAVILDTTTTDGSHAHAAYPTTTPYDRGQILSWEWDLRKVWGPA